MAKKIVKPQSFRARYRQVLICAAIVAATLTVYRPVQHFGFVSFDDNLYVARNANVQNGLSTHGLLWAVAFMDRSDLLYWQPLTWLSHMLDVALFGPARAGTI